MRFLRNVALEMSLKPFKKTGSDEVDRVCRQVFTQWGALGQQADTISILLWVSDGSEILDYRGDQNQVMEWAKYIGGANNRGGWNQRQDPQGIGLHTTFYPYMDEPPVFTYGMVREIVSALKSIGREITGKIIKVGATFDPGPEFAKSDFKYVRHPEILLGDTMGKKSFVCCYARLNGDGVPYAGYPDGIPEGTPFGTFFGRQSTCYLKDMGFDYLWFSNGFGFGTETWGTTGAIFDGYRFASEKVKETQGRINDFWRFFRQECTLPVETRGTNLTAGIDLATDGVNLKAIYEGDFDILAPPNSPWAALNGDFGLELAGYMSRVAQLPCGSGDDDFLFRFYVHDPWWMNSPWEDRYEGQPHDIFLPLAVSRLDGQGKTHHPNRLNLLTIDNSLGDMPPRFASEVTPHLFKAYEHIPDAPAPVVWVYPFDEYHDLAGNGHETGVEKPFFEDWFMRGAVNHGFPVSSVISTRNFIRLMTDDSGNAPCSGSVLVTPVPPAGGPMELMLMEFVRSGGHAIVYGSVGCAGHDFMDFLNLGTGIPLDGVLDLDLMLKSDIVKAGAYSSRISHDSLLSDGGIDTVLKIKGDGHTKVLAQVRNRADTRVFGIFRDDPGWATGSLVWLRGTNSNTYTKGAHLLTPHDASEFFPVETLLRLALQEFGYYIVMEKENHRVPDAVTMVYRHDNGFFFSGYVPNTTLDLKLGFPLGAPLLLGVETKLADNHSTYRMPRAWHAECRVFVDQGEDTIISCREEPPVSYQKRRRIRVAGLKDATVRIFPQKGHEDSTEIMLNSHYPFLVGEEFRLEFQETPWGRVLVIEGVTGSLMISC